MKRNILIVLLIVLSSILLADGNETKICNNLITMSGQITDKITNEILVGVELNIDDKKVYTDLDGKYTITTYPGEHKLEIKYISYQNDLKTIKIESNCNMNIQISQTK